MSEKPKFDLITWITNHACAIIFILLVPIVVNFTIWIGNKLFELFQINIFNLAQVTNTDWFLFIGSYLASIGTIFLAYVAITQNEESNYVNKKMANLTERATDIEEKMLKMEKDKKMPFLLIDPDKEMKLTFFPLINPENPPDPQNNPVKMYSQIVEPNTILFTVKYDQHILETAEVMFEIEFFLMNCTENIVNGIGLTQTTIVLYDGKSKNIKRTLQNFENPICTRIIQQKQKVIIRCLLDPTIIQEVNSLCENKVFVHLLLNIDFEIKNIFSDSYVCQIDSDLYANINKNVIQAKPIVNAKISDNIQCKQNENSVSD